MRLLYLTRTYTKHDARWLRVLVEQGLDLGFLPLQRIDGDIFTREHPEVKLLASPDLPAGATTSQLDHVGPAVRSRSEQWGPDAILAGPLTDAGYVATRFLPEQTLLMSWAFDVLHEPETVPGAGDRLQRTLAAGQNLFTDCHALIRQCEIIARRKFRRTCVLPWGLAAEDKPAPGTGWRERLGDQKGKVVLYTRGFEPVHQPDLVVEAFRQASAQDDSLCLWIAGDGSFRDRLEGRVNAASLHHVVRFLGRLDQPSLAGAFAESDVYLACSLSDGCSISLLQAMYAGLPCVVSDIPGNREWLESGSWLVPTGQAAAFARALTECAALSAKARTEIAAVNRLRVKTRADLTANLPNLLQTLRLVADLSPFVASEHHFLSV